MVVEGSSQWLIEINLTRCVNIEYIGTNSIRLPDIFLTDRIQMKAKSHHIHIDIRSLIGFESIISIQESPCTVALAETTGLSSSKALLELMNWSSIRWIVDLIHAHVCCNSSFCDIRTLLVPNSLWNENPKIIW